MAHPSDAIHGILHPAISAYLAELSGPADEPLIDRMEALAAERRFPIVGRATGRWLELLARIFAAERVFEFGSGYGYSALFFARGGAQVWGSDTNPHWIDVHRDLWDGHPLADRVHLSVGRGDDLLRSLDGTFDLVLIDSTKVEYGDDLELALSRLRPGGAVLVDNVLWGGRVTTDATDDSTRAIQAFNRKLFADPRLNVAILPVGDGMALARKA